MTINSKILIGTIFSNIAVPSIISGNLTAISDHFPQFLLALNIFFSIPLTLNPINIKEIGQDLIEKVLYLIIFWLMDNFLLSSNANTGKYYKTFLEKSESLLDTYAPLKKNPKNKSNFKYRP